MIYVQRVNIKDILPTLHFLVVMLGGNARDVVEVSMSKVETPCSPSDK